MITYDYSCLFSCKSNDWQPEHNAPVQVRFELITKDEFRRKGNHLNVYCLKATKDDPASRLAVFVKGTSDNRAPFAGWLRSNAEKQVFKINTLVDMLECGSMTKSRHLPRRWIVLKCGSCFPKWLYRLNYHVVYFASWFITNGAKYII